MHAIVHMVHVFVLQMKVNSFDHSGWSSLQVREVPGGGGLWGGDRGLGQQDKGESGYQENISF